MNKTENRLLGLLKRYLEWSSYLEWSEKIKEFIQKEKFLLGGLLLLFAIYFAMTLLYVLLFGLQAFLHNRIALIQEFVQISLCALWGIFFKIHLLFPVVKRQS